MVISIIAVLIGLLLPALGAAREAAARVKCQSNMRQIATAFYSFSADHGGHLPGNKRSDGRAGADEPHKRSWLGPGTYVTDVTAGTIYPYISGSTDVYRCTQLPVLGPRGSGEGSNGLFDFAAFGVFQGAQVADIAPTATLDRSGTSQRLFVPLIIEEHPKFFINTNNDVEGEHLNIDQAAVTHDGDALYGSIDGSAHFLENSAGITANNWTGQKASGKAVSLGTFRGVDWNWWGAQ